MLKNVAEQKKVFEANYHIDNLNHFSFNFSDDKIIRYTRDRRLNIALKYLESKYDKTALRNFSVLIVCGGVGGESFFFNNAGFNNITLSDFSENSLSIANKLFPDLKTMCLNAENLNLADCSFDIVVVQDGLHHLPRPALGFTEMIRVAKKEIIVIEPYESLIGNLIGTTWEVQGDAINFVYRWNKKMVEQTVKSYLLHEYNFIKVFRVWDHNLTVRNFVKKLPKPIQLFSAKAIYAFLSLINFSGNMMIAIVSKKEKS
jgi:ubiquinone/menaquinone biosynthesis C-methylase UbiE